MNKVALMRIGYISFEYPVVTAYGGIATYVYQAAHLMLSRGHSIEVFSSTPGKTCSEIENGILVHRVHCTDRDKFREAILPVFSDRHHEFPFELIESPEYFADALCIKRRFSDLPLVVKLHTPESFIRALSATYVKLWTKIRFQVGAIRRGKWADSFWRWKTKENDVDYQITVTADQIHSPSLSLAAIVAKKWDIQNSKILNVPYPFIPNPSFLSIEPECSGDTIAFIGRLEVRKGIVELVKALPLIFDAVESSNIIFVGKDSQSHIEGLTMKEFIASSLTAYSGRIRFMEVGNKDIPSVLQNVSVCVFPSIWENFPNVCLEAMSAARAIVASNRGGMADMLANSNAGILVDPMNPGQIAREVIRLLRDPNHRKLLGTRARKYVLEKYNAQLIGELMEKHYSNLKKQW